MNSQITNNRKVTGIEKGGKGQLADFGMSIQPVHLEVSD